MSWIVAMLMLLFVTPVSVAPVALPLPHGATGVAAPAGAATTFSPTGTSSAATSAITTNGDPSILAARVPTMRPPQACAPKQYSFSGLSFRVTSAWERCARAYRPEQGLLSFNQGTLCP